MANVTPKAHTEVIRLYQAGDLKGAIEVQNKLSNADGSIVKLGVAGVKGSVAKYFGYGTSRSRRPLGEMAPEKLSGDIASDIEKVVELEKSL